MKHSSRFLLHSLSVIAVSLLSLNTPVYADPVNIETSPLFLSNNAQPNIFFMVDDSGSMDVELLTNQKNPGFGGSMYLFAGTSPGSFSNGVYFYLFGDGVDDSQEVSWNASGGNAVNQYRNRYILPTQAFINTAYAAQLNDDAGLLRGVWRGRNSNYNRLFYDPTKDYKPWRGLNRSGNAYPDYRTGPLVTTVPIDPYNDAAATINLLATYNVTSRDRDNNEVIFNIEPTAYNLWNQAGGNGDAVVDPVDPYTRVVIRGNVKCSQPLLLGCLTKTYNEEIRNFANWFVYHRKREHTTKFAISEVINPASGVRMGMATINDQAASNIELAEMQTGDPTSTKANLLNRLFRMDSPSGTPLRRALVRAGRYYECAAGGPNFPAGSDRCAREPTINGFEPAACAQNFTILLTDGEYNNFIPPPFTEPLTLPSYPNAFAGYPGVGNVDGNTAASSANITYFDGLNNVTTNLTFGNFAPYTDGVADTLADIAMRYYARDLAPTIPNQVPMTCGIDENPAQHMVTYTVGFGVTGSNAIAALNLGLVTTRPHPQLGHENGCPVTAGTPIVWPAGPASVNFNGANKIDDLAHAAINGRGLPLSAQDPTALAKSLTDAFDNISGRLGSAASVAVNSSTISTSSTAYLALFNSSTWEGDLSALSIDTSGNINPVPNWNAQVQLNAITPDNRAIVTHNRATRTSFGFRASNFPASFSTRQQEDLNTPEDGGPLDTFGPQRLDHIRGVETCETGYTTVACTLPFTFRKRKLTSDPTQHFKLGDVVNSSPIYVGSPLATLPGDDPFGSTGKRHRDYKIGTSSGAFNSTNNASNRTPMLYVGANDGMLHAFNAATGDEVWAYVPDSLYQTDLSIGHGLRALTQASYTHQYYVDLSPSVADVYIDSDGAGPNSDEWHTVLVGGLRAGGRGIFAIDVTDPDELISEATPALRENKLANRILWEFSNVDDPDLGFTYSKPQIVPLGSATGIEYYVVIGNGYESLNVTATNPYTTLPYSSKLFILKLEGPGSDGVWTRDTDYWVIDTQQQNGGSANRNGMSTPVLADSDDDDISDLAYAGDLEGRMWAFDLAGTPGSIGSWGIYKNSGAITPLFTTQIDTTAVPPQPQPITTQPALAFNSAIATQTTGASRNAPNLLVYFGTGSYRKVGDLVDQSNQTFYAVWDDGNGTNVGHTISNLVQQTIDETDVVTIPGPPPTTLSVRTIPSEAPVTYPTDKGWYIDLPTAGERSILKPIALGNLIFFKTIIPSADPCGFGGNSWDMFVNGLTGGPPPRPVLDSNDDGIADLADKSDGGTNPVGLGSDRLILGNTFIDASGNGGPNNDECVQYDIKTLSDGTTQRTNKTTTCAKQVGRYSWRELNFAK